MKITLIFCFRERINLFENLINSLLKTTHDLSSIEILVAIDDDDIRALNSRDKFIAMAKPMDLQFFIFKQTENFIRDYINPLARKAKGRWVIIINDDTEFVTSNWDKSIDEAMSKKADIFKDDILLGLIDDGHGREGEDKLFPHFSAWPVISKESIDALGYFFHERFVIWGADHFIANVYRRCQRLVSLVFIRIDHNSVHNGRRPADDNHAKFCKIWDKNAFKFNETMVEEDAEKLIEYLKKKHGKRYEITKGPLTIY